MQKQALLKMEKELERVTAQYNALRTMEGKAMSERIKQTKDMTKQLEELSTLADGATNDVARNKASIADLSARMGHDLSIHRWRGNLWLSGAPAWDEWSWIGKRLTIGDAVLEIRERITRCSATTVEPATGISNADTLRALETHFGHQDFGLYAVVVNGGTIATGDAITLPDDRDDVIVFHAGTKRLADDTLVTSGGRVVAVTAIAADIRAAQQASAAAAAQVKFEGAQFRRDIGWRELARGSSRS
jgi:uncharacterized protein YcbX